MSSTRRGAALVTAGTFAWALTQWYLVWLFARFAGGAEAVGAYAALIAVATPLFILGQLGLRTVYLTLRQHWPWRSYVQLRIAGIAVASLALAAFVVWDGRQPVALAVSVIALKCADSALDLLMAPIQRSGRLTQLGSLTLGNALGTVVVASVAVGVTGLMHTALFGSAAVSLWICFLAWRLSRKPLTELGATGSGKRRIIKSGIPVMMSQGVASFSTYLPVWLLSRWADSGVIGVYSAAAYLLTAANLVGSSTQTVLLPSFRSRFESTGHVGLLSRASRLASILAIGGVLAAPIAVTFGSSILAMLYGSGFEMSRFSLLLLSIAAIAVAPSYVYSVVLVVLNRYKTELLIWVVALVFAMVVGVALLVLGVEPLTSGFAVALTAAWVRLGGVAGFAAFACRTNLLVATEPRTDQAATLPTGQQSAGEHYRLHVAGE